MTLVHSGSLTAFENATLNVSSRLHFGKEVTEARLIILTLAILLNNHFLPYNPVHAVSKPISCVFAQ